jgi:hypothetical protein
MLKLLAALPTYLQIGTWAGAAILLTYLLMVLIHRLIPFDVRHEHNDVIGFIIAVISVFYGLVMASVLVIAVNRFDHAQQVVEREANLIGDVVRNARTISPQLDKAVTGLAIKYLDDVISNEWPTQKQGQTTLVGLQTLTEIDQALSRYEPRNRHESAYYSTVLQQLNELHDFRRERIFLAAEKIDPEIWAVSLAGGVLTICFVLLFGIRRRNMHFLLASFLAMSIALIFALISLFDKPFQGEISVSAEPYRLVLHRIKSN